MIHHQTSYHPLRRPNGVLVAGSLMAEGEGRGELMRRVLDVAPDWVLGGRVDRMRIILLREGQSERRFQERRLAYDPRDAVDEEVGGRNHHVRPSPPKVSAEDRPAPTRQGGRLACRRVFPEPGHECLVSWEHIGGLLAGQLAHPERLHQSHRLRCHAQVYEATAPHRIEELAAAMLGDPAFVAELHPLTDVLAARLGLALMLPSRPAHSPRRREPGVVLAGDRLVRVCAADDPTADGPPPRAMPRATELRDALTRGAGQRRTIPEHYLRPWELRRSRQEVVYDMHVLAHSSWLRRLLRRLRGPRLRRAELLRWEVMLSGKPIEEQLWSVRPPLADLSHPRVRKWAQEALGAAGYDAGAMVAEWEIYWRRKA
jgi:hypothetical protein